MVLELESPIKDLLEKLRPDIERGLYQIIIGEDVSGHIPALILAHSIKAIYRARGTEKPLLGYVAGSKAQRGEKAQRKVDLINPYVAGLKEQKGAQITWESPEEGFLTNVKEILKSIGLRHGGAKALVVTENITGGTSIAPIIQSFREQGIQADIATMSYDSEEKGLGTLEDQLGAKVITALDSTIDIAFFKNKELTGFVKDPRELMATPMQLTAKGASNRREVRRVASEISNRIAAEYLAKGV